MDRFSTRLAAGVMADRQREAALARRADAAAAQHPAAAPVARPIGPAVHRILQGLGRGFGLRSAAR